MSLVYLHKNRFQVCYFDFGPVPHENYKGGSLWYQKYKLYLLDCAYEL